MRPVPSPKSANLTALAPRHQTKEKNSRCVKCLIVGLIQLTIISLQIVQLVGYCFWGVVVRGLQLHC